MSKVNKIRKKLTLLSLVMLSSCFSNTDIKIGKKKVKGSENLYVVIYQRDEFDYVTAVSYELIDSQDSIIISKKYLTGTDDKLGNLRNFDPFLKDSIFYLCYPYPKIYALKNLNKLDSPTGSLINILNQNDKKLYDAKRFSTPNYVRKGEGKNQQVTERKNR